MIDDVNFEIVFSVIRYFEIVVKIKLYSLLLIYNIFVQMRSLMEKIVWSNFFFFPNSI